MGQSRGQFICQVIANQPLCREHYKLVLWLEDFPATEPGQFLQISCDAIESSSGRQEIVWEAGQLPDVTGDELSEPSAYLRRPFSLAGRRDTSGGVELEFIHRVVGLGTQWLSKLKPGDQVRLLGPLGNRFVLPREEQTAILVGGGVGIPPMLYLASHLAGGRAVAFCGAVSHDLLPLTIVDQAGSPGAETAEPLMNIAEFATHGIPSVITTDDGSYGFRGYVTQALERFLDSSSAALLLSPSPTLLIYTCGPEPMMKRVARIAADRGIECQVAVERAMACGMGTCQSCCIRVLKPDPARPPLAGSEWCWRLACTDGPIFRGAELLW
jgi:dihydroorotate dehydrogenase electron transfer subunit